MKKSIHQIAAEIIRDEGKPLTAQDIYQRMVDQNLYVFNAKNPATVVRSQLRRHSVNNESNNKAGDSIFKMVGDAFDLN